MKVNIYSSIIVILIVLGTFACTNNIAVRKSGLPKVEEVDLQNINPSLFAMEEWYMPYYLKHFAEVANSVVDTGCNRGYIDISVWRTEDVNQPYNARIMESIMSLAWYYTQQRDWNPYYQDQALKARLEAALTFWCNMQNSNGKFSEYDYNKWSLAPTAFATKFIGRALFLIHQEQKIDSEIYNRAVKAWRKALYIGFTDERFWEHGRNFTNQFANLWGGALMYLYIYSDPEIEHLFRDRLNQSVTEFQSPCGFFYEKGGPDWGYNLGTHHSDLHMAWEFAKGTELEDIIVSKTYAWYDWFSYNAIKEPGSLCYYLNRAIETRQQKGYYENIEVKDPAYQRWVPQAELVPIACAYEISQQEFDSSNTTSYKKMLVEYPKVIALKTGEFRAFSPYAFLHQDLLSWHPDKVQKEQAIKQLPYLKDEKFVHVRHDERSNTSYSFVRNPKYYAIFNSGKILTKQQRYGLGLIWTPNSGTFFQSQSKTDVAAYGTKAENNNQVYEARDLFPVFTLDKKQWKPVEAINNMKSGEFSVRYELGDKGTKEIHFCENRIVVKIVHEGAFKEILPLLLTTNDELSIGTEKITIRNKASGITIGFKGASEIDKQNFDTDLNKKICEVCTVKSMGELEYEITFD